MRLFVLAVAACQVATAAPKPPVTITNLGPGRFVIDGTAKLKTVAVIEHLDGATWKPASDHFDIDKGYRLLASCSWNKPPGDCVDVDGSLAPVPWSGMSCSSQCNWTCRANAPLAAGDYRLVVKTCDGATTIAGPTFHFDFDGTPFERSGITSDVGAAAVARADLPANGYDPAVAASGRIAGLVIRGTPKAMDGKSTDALLALLRDRKGFATGVEKRCKSDHHVGFQLSRPHGEVAEVTIDFACNRVFAAYGGGGNGERRVASAFFDPSRAAWVAFAKQVLPDDAEIGKLP